MNRLIFPSCSWFAMVVISGLGAATPVALGQQVLPQTSAIQQQQQAPHPLDPAFELARASLQHIQENVDDYTALFIKRYRMDGELTEMQYANVKIRNRKIRDGINVTPMAVYLDFLKPSSVKGREVIWVDGENDGKLIAHDTGIRKLINVTLDPNSYLAMRGQRHPITEIGIEKLLTIMIETVERDRQYGECDIQFRDIKVSEANCTMLQVIHPVRREHFDFYCARMYFDRKLNIPIRYESWSWPEKSGEKPVLEEEYTYLQMKVNVGLTDQDFSIGNSDYGFQ
jgi:hypothetical protein